MSHQPEWTVCTITFNVAMKQASEEVVDAMLSHIDGNKVDILAIGMQEVAHAETLGGTFWTWQRLIVDWITMRLSLYLVCIIAMLCFIPSFITCFVLRKFQDTPGSHFWERFPDLLGTSNKDIPSYKPDTRVLEEIPCTSSGLTGHKGSIGLRITLQSGESLVFVVSHFVHDVAAYKKRLLQYESNRICTFEEDKKVSGIFWLGDLNFRVELEPQDAFTQIKHKKLNELQENSEQLHRAMSHGEAFHGFREAPIKFKPTYRLTIGTAEFDLKRTPSWCDRILYKGNSIKPNVYESLTDVLISDHLPVLGTYSIQLNKIAQIDYDAVFEHMPTFYSPLTVVGRFQLKNDFWSKGGSYMDWIGLYPSAILDCTTAVKWVWVATCYEQIHEGQKYYVCEFINVQPGKYRLGYYSSYRGCIVGLSKSFVVADTPS